MEENKTLEKSFEELDAVLTKLEKPDVTLEESFSLYREGMKLLQEANAKIDRIEKEIIVLSEE